MKKLHYLGLLVGLFSTVCFASNMCTETVKQLQGMDYHTSLSDIKIEDLKTKLGKASVQTLKEQKLSWGEFSILTRDGQTIITEGKKPKGVSDFPSMKEAAKALGKPLEGPINQLHQYTWECEDTSSTVTIMASPDGKVLSLNGAYCDPANPKGCTYFGRAM